MTSLAHLIETEEMQNQLQGVVERHKLEDYSALIQNILVEIFEGRLYYEDFDGQLESQVDEVTDDILSAESEIYLLCIEPFEDELETLFQSHKRNFQEILQETQARFTIETEGERYKDRLARFLKSFFEGEYDGERTIRSLSKGFKPGGLEMSVEDATALVESLEEYVGRVTYEPYVAPAIEQERPVADVSSSASFGLVASSAIDTPDELVSHEPEVLPTQEIPHIETPVQEVVAPTEVKPQTTAVVAREMIDTVEELQQPPAEVVPEKLLPEKAREQALYQAKAALLQKNTFAGTPSTTVPVTSSRDTSSPTQTILPPQSTPITNVASLCDVLEEHEVEELLQAKEGIDERIADETRIHEELQKVFQRVVEGYAKFLSSSELCDRFYRLIIARLKGLKNQYATRDTVLAAVDQGGLGFSPSQADEFLTFLEQQKTELQETWDQEVNIKKEQFLAERREQLFTSKSTVPPLKTVATNQMTGDIIGMVATPLKPPVAVAQHLQTAKPIMHDVHNESPMLDGVSELGSYTLEDFHRLSKDPQQAAQKIEQKIDILGQWMYVKRAQGIDAWKDSSLMRLYREHLQQSLMGDMTISEVIERRTQAGQMALTLQEIEALTELSSRLRK
jgi:hypothetical protein